MKVPLAERMRPRNLDEFIGQEHILGPGRLLRRAIQADRITSVIFSGPPGTGKTTLARVIANTTKAQFLALNAVLAGVKDIREAIESAREARAQSGRGTLLFVDEVHRFNKAQQDALLPHVENGTLILIGATTENPYFEVNKALVSRSRIFQLRPLEERHLLQTLEAAVRDGERGYGALSIDVESGALEHIVRMAQGDARSALNALELAVETTTPDATGLRHISLAVAEESIQRKAVLYDKDGDAHYDTISAFIKSVRGSDPDAALYWLAKMVEAGEDPRFIFRRMIILASEDVGLADPNALRVAMSAAQAFDYVGLPEGQFHLAEACLYLATAPKSNSGMAYFDALEVVRQERIDAVPDAIKDKSRDGDLGHGQNYLYPHAFRDHWVAQQYLPSGLRGRVFYDPSRIGFEAGLRDDVIRRREAQLAALSESVASPAPKAGRSGWLERAAGVGSDVLRQMRDDLCDAAGLRRESLVLDLGGHHGFLTWEAMRRCVEGGVWSRCETEAEKNELEAWLQRVEPLLRPTLWVSGLPQLPENARALSPLPQFDQVIGFKVPVPSWEWIETLRQSVAPAARFVLASQREDEMGRWSEWLGSAPDALRKAVLDALEKTAPNVDRREGIFEIQEKSYTDRRRLTSTQARHWLLRGAEKPDSHTFRLREMLGPEQWNLALQAAVDTLASGPREFKTIYEFWIGRPGV